MNKKDNGTVTNDIRINQLLSVVWSRKIVVLSITLLFSLSSVIYVMQLSDIFKSEVTLVPAEDSALKVPGELGGLAALAGVNIGGMGGGDKSALAYEILKSNDFIGRFIKTNDLFIPLMAVNGWDRLNDKLVIDPEIYNEIENKWVRKVKQPFTPKPSIQEAIEAFKKSFSVSKDKTTGIVRLSIEYYSPVMAKTWVDLIVKTVNEEMRARDLLEAERSIDYLNKQIEITKVVDVKAMLFSLIEEQTKTVMLANVRDEYVFKTIDPAVISEKKEKPARALICIIGTILGFMFGSLIVLVFFISKSNSI